jgi:hypothetical protein
MTPEERLTAYEAMHSSIQNNYDQISIQLDQLKAAGRDKGVTYRQLLSNKTTLQIILDFYKIYGL